MTLVKEMQFWLHGHLGTGNNVPESWGSVQILGAVTVHVRQAKTTDTN